MVNAGTYLQRCSIAAQADRAFVEKREESGDMGRDIRTDRGVQPVAPCPNNTFLLIASHEVV